MADAVIKADRVIRNGSAAVRPASGVFSSRHGPPHPSLRYEKLALQGQSLIRSDTVSLDSPSAVWNDFANPEIILAHGSRAAKAGPLH